MTAAADQLKLDLAASRRDGLGVMIARAAVAGEPLPMVEAFVKADAAYTALADEVYKASLGRRDGAA